MYCLKCQTDSGTPVSSVKTTYRLPDFLPARLPARPPARLPARPHGRLPVPAKFNFSKFETNHDWVAMQVCFMIEKVRRHVPERLSNNGLEPELRKK